MLPTGSGHRHVGILPPKVDIDIAVNLELARGAFLIGDAGLICGARASHAGMQRSAARRTGEKRS